MVPPYSDIAAATSQELRQASLSAEVALAKKFRVPETNVRIRATLREVDAIGVLVVRLKGGVTTAEELWRVIEAIDDCGTSHGEVAEVSVLDVRKFANIADDQAARLTGALQGLPCCWVANFWEHQDVTGDRDWRLPPLGRLAGDLEDALQRVVGWRRANAMRLPLVEDGSRCLRGRWTERGFELVHEGRHGSCDLWFHNRLIERTFQFTRVRWPFPDRTGVQDLAQQLGARVVWQDDRVDAVDRSEPPPGYDVPPDWLDELAWFRDVTRFDLPPISVTDGQLVAVLAGLPRLTELWLSPTTEWGPEIEEALCTGWRPTLRHVYGTRDVIPELSRRQIQNARPDLVLHG
ncbi:MAG: hypothetical protein AAGA48_30620 [Myxococcota bacterium]